MAGLALATLLVAVAGAAVAIAVAGASIVTAWAQTLPSTIPVKSPVLGQRWQAWRAAADRPDLLGPAIPGDDLDDRKSATAAVREALAALDADLTVAADPTRPPSVAAAVSRRREAELAALSSGLTPGVGLPQGPSADERSAAAAAFAKWVGDLSSLAADFRLSGPAAGAIWTLDDLADRPDRRPKWADRLAGDLDVLTEVADARARLDALQALLASSRDALLTSAKTAPTFERRYAAWQALSRGNGVEPTWLSQPGDLALDDAVRDGLAKLKPATPGVPKPTGLPAEAEVKQRWQRFAGTVGDDRRAREAVDSLVGRVGRTSAAAVLGEVNAIAGPAARLNILLRLGRDLSAIPAGAGAAAAVGATDADLAAVRAAVAATVAKFPGDRPDLADLRRRLAEPEPFVAKATQPTFDLPLPGGGTVAMLRVEPRGRRAYYLSADEVTFGQFARMVRPATQPGQTAAPPSPQVMASLKAADAKVVGPRVWQLAGSPEAVAVNVPTGGDKPRWLPAGKNNFADALRDPMLDNREVLDPAAGGSPTENHPMQQLPATAAALAALGVDCRLPTAAEWAWATERPPAPGAKPPPANLRDPTWVAQWRYVVERQRMGKPAAFPDEGAFVPADLRGRVKVGPAAVVAGDPAGGVPSDRTLYFRPSPGEPLPPATGETPPFRDLVGNVAELTFEAPEVLSALPDKARLTAADVEKALRANPTKLHVIGLSALSAPALKQGEPYAVDPATPYADVGFRLAFTAPFASERDRLRWVVAEQPYVAAGSVR